MFESKVYLSKGSIDTPKLNGDGKIVYFYPIRILNGTERVRIDEQNKGDVFGDGRVSFEYDENGGSGSLAIGGAEMIVNNGDISISTQNNVAITMGAKELNLYSLRGKIRQCTRLRLWCADLYTERHKLYGGESLRTQCKP